jgi:NAD(P) transhydrogenase subunit beta
VLIPVVQAVYLLAAVLFIASLAGLSTQTSARRGTALGMIGMGLALAATVVLSLERSSRPALVTLLLIAMALAVGATLGIWRARQVEMTQMPEMIALLHSFVGLAAVLVGFGSYLTEPADVVHQVEVFLGVFIGAITLTGSVVAFLKLSERMRSAPLMLPGRNLLNLGALVGSAGLMVWFLNGNGIVPLLLMTAVALLLGWHLWPRSAAATCRW